MSQALSRRMFTKEFKLEAARLGNRPGMTVGQAARYLDIRTKLFYHRRGEFPQNAERGL